MKITINKGMSGKYVGDFGQEKPRFGRNWFFYLPSLSWNKGIFWKNEVTDTTFRWLFFWIGLTIWGNNKNNKHSYNITSTTKTIIN